MTSRIKKLQEIALTSPMINDIGYANIVKNSFAKNKDKPECIKKAIALYDYFSMRGIAIDDLDIIPIKNVQTEIVKLEFDDIILEETKQEKFPFMQTMNKGLWAYGKNHNNCDFETFIDKGIVYYQNKINQKLNNGNLNKKEIDFLESLLITCDAIILLVNRYENLCSSMIKNEISTKRKKELIKMQKALKNVPKNGATNFYEAVVSMWIAFFLYNDSVGRLDKYLYKYYKKDKYNYNEALELIESLYIKMFSVLGTDSGRSADNHIVIGGVLENGESGYNNITEMVLTAVDELDVYRPQVTFRWHSDLEYSKLILAVRINKDKYDHLTFINDDVIINGLMKMDIDYSVASNYSLSSCNEVILTGVSNMGSLGGFFNILKVLEILLNTDSKLHDLSVVSDNEIFAVDNYLDFYLLFEKQLRRCVAEIFDISYYTDKKYAENAEYINPLESLTIDGCIDFAKGYNEGGARYNFCNWSAVGIVELVDSLSIIKQFVFDEKIIPLKEFINLLQSNWLQNEMLRCKIIKNGHFFGNDDDYVDNIVWEVVNSINILSRIKTPYRGGYYNFGATSGIENMHVKFGNQTGATPNGRYIGDAFAASICVVDDKDKNGSTAFLKSVSKLDFTMLPSSVVVNLKLDKSIILNDKNIIAIADMINTYFINGGAQLQLNHLSDKELLDAQENPACYKNLRVQVSGYSDYFTELIKDVQDEVIKRTLNKVNRD